MAYRYLLLGPLEVGGDREPAAPETPKLASVLAHLVCRANQVVTTSAIIDDLWGASAPKSASATVQTYVYLLRKFFRAQGFEESASPLCTHPSGYVLRVDPNDMDTTAFDRLMRAGRSLIEAGRPTEALVSIREALSLWRGPALVNVPSSPVVQARVAHLDEALMRTRELQIQANFMLGRYREMIGELARLATLHPLNEWIYERLIEALSRAGRRADALRAFQRLRSNLAEQLGVRPSPSLHRLELDVLNARIPLQGFEVLPAAHPVL
jgi:DNA-binding SARP family transcriptional activator